MFARSQGFDVSGRSGIEDFPLKILVALAVPLLGIAAGVTASTGDLKLVGLVAAITWVLF